MECTLYPAANKSFVLKRAGRKKGRAVGKRRGRWGLGVGKGRRERSAGKRKEKSYQET